MPKNLCLLLFFCLSGGAAVAQQLAEERLITIREASIRVGDLLREISRQSGADFSYNAQVVNAEAKISFQVQDATLEETLDRLSSQIQVAYTIVEGQIVLNFAAEEPAEKFNLSGFLTDQTTGESLIGASVAVRGTPRGAFTNEFGYYSLTLESSKPTIVYSYVGYEPVTMPIYLQQDVRQNVALSPATMELPEIVVDRSRQDVVSQTSLGKLVMAPDRLNNLPEFGGESGLIKGLQSLPGIQTHSDGSAFFYTRGGERDQNLIIIDDAPIYNPSHLLGFYSIVIPDFAKQVTVYKSDLPASMGDRLSSIISIRTKDGNLNKAELSGAFNPLINRLSASLPLFKKRSALFVSIRGSNFDWLYRSVNNEADIGFGDFHLKWNYQISDKDRLFFTSIQGWDVLASDSDPINGVRWGNSATTLRWNHIFGPKLFSNTIIYSGNYAYNLNTSPNFWKSELGAISFKTDFTHYASPNHTARFGLEVQSFFTNPGEVSVDSTVAILPDIASDQARKGVLYYQGALDIEPFQLNLGFRLINWENHGPRTYYQLDENYEPADTVEAGEGVYNQYIDLDPRLSIRYQLDSAAFLKLSLGSYHQYLQLVQNSISPFTAFEVWLPAGPNTRPQSATQLALDFQKYFPRSGVTLSAAAYYKLARNQIDYVAHATTYLNPLLESELRFGRSRAYGLELMVRKDFGRLNGWLKYGYARVFRKTEGINNNDWYPAFQDRPHDFSLVVNYELTPRLVATAFWTSHSGSAFTTPVGFYTFNEQTVPLYGERNNDRLPAYHRLDLSLRFQINKDPAARYRHNLTFSLYNALAHPNVFAVKFNKRLRPNFSPPVPVNTLSEELLSASQIDLIRFFPSLTYKFNL